MGKPATMTVKEETAVYVPTGGMVPEGADAIVMIEYVEVLDDINIIISKPVVQKENIIDIGDDIKENQRVLLKGMKLIKWFLKKEENKYITEPVN